MERTIFPPSGETIASIILVTKVDMDLATQDIGRVPNMVTLPVVGQASMGQCLGALNGATMVGFGVLIWFL